MNILVTGASGLIGSALVPFLVGQGNRVTKVVRSTAPSNSDVASWDPEAERIDISHAGHIDAVVHLAAHPIGGRWSKRTKELIRESRIGGTRLLSEALARRTDPPPVLVSASAVGFYGDRGEDWMDESSGAGDGFLADVCQKWEGATLPATTSGVRVVLLRFGLVLSRRGGALAKMLPAYRSGLGGKLGDGRQYWSWISIDDAVSAIHHSLVTPGLAGPVNAVAPDPVTNGDFTKTLGQSLGRPALFSVPRPMVRLLFGEMGREALLSSCRAKPSRLLATGFRFQHPELRSAFDDLLRR